MPVNIRDLFVLFRPGRRSNCIISFQEQTPFAIEDNSLRAREAVDEHRLRHTSTRNCTQSFGSSLALSRVRSRMVFDKKPAGAD